MTTQVITIPVACGIKPRLCRTMHNNPRRYVRYDKTTEMLNRLVRCIVYIIRGTARNRLSETVGLMRAKKKNHADVLRTPLPSCTVCAHVAHACVGVLLKLFLTVVCALALHRYTWACTGCCCLAVCLRSRCTCNAIVLQKLLPCPIICTRCDMLTQACSGRRCLTLLCALKLHEHTAVYSTSCIAGAVAVCTHAGCAYGDPSRMQLSYPTVFTRVTYAFLRVSLMP